MASEIVELILRAKDLASESVNRLRGGMENLRDASKQYNATLDRLRGSADEFKNTMLKIGAVVGVAGLARSFVDISASAEKTKLMLAGLMGSTEKAAEAFDWLLQVSTQAPFNINAMKDAFVKLQVAGLDPMRGSLETLMDAISAFGGSNQDLQNASVAIQQMAGKGVISMEELRQQLGERIPTAMKAMAEGLGMSMEELVKAIESGNISATEGLNAMMGKLKEWYGGTGVEMMNSWNGLISNLQVAWEKFVLMLGETGIFDRLKTTIEGLLKKIEEMKKTGELQSWGDRISTVVNTVISVVTTLAGVIGELLDTFGPFLPALIQSIVYLKVFQIAVMGPIGMIAGLVAQMFALRDAIVKLIPKLIDLKTSMISTATSAGALKIAIGIGLVGAAIAAGYAIGKLIDYLIWGKKRQEEFAEAAERTAQAQQEQARNEAELEQRLTALGFTTGSVEQKWKAFNKAVEEGVIVWDEQEQAYRRVEKATEDQKKTYEELIAAVKVGSEQFMKIMKLEADTLKATIDYEIALEEQKYKQGQTSLDQYLTFRERRSEDYVNRIIYLKGIELEELKKEPEANLDKIKAIEEEIKQLKLQSAQEQISIRQELSEGLKEEYQKDFDNWKKLQELRLGTLRSNLDLQDAIEQAAVQRGEMREEEYLERKLQRIRKAYEEEIRIAEEAVSRISAANAKKEQLSEEDIIAYEEAVAHKEQLQNEYKKAVIQSEQEIAEAKVKITKEAAEKTVEAVKEEQKAVFAITTDTLNAYIDYVDNRRQRLQDAVKGMLTDTWEDVKQYFGGWKEAAATTARDVQEQIDQFMKNTTYASYETFWNATLYGRRMLEMVGTSIYEWSERVTGYINYVKGLLQSLREYIDGLRVQLMQIRGDRLGELEMWYEQERKQLEEKYANELKNTKEYYQAMNLLDELYKEKKKKVLEEMEREEDAYIERREEKGKRGGGAGGIVETIKGLFPELTGMTMPGMGTAGEVEVKVSRELKLDSIFEIKTFDIETTDRYIRDVFYPRFEQYLKLKGIEL